MNKLFFLLIYLFIGATSIHAQQTKIKKWNEFSSMMGMSASSVESLLSKNGYKYDDQDEEDGIKIRYYVNPNVTYYDEIFEDDLEDEIQIGFRNGLVIFVRIILADNKDSEGSAAGQYYRFSKGLNAAGFGLIRQEKFEGTRLRYFHNASRKQKIIVQQWLEGTTVTEAEILIYNDEDDTKEELDSHIFNFSDLASFARQMNGKMKNARVNFQTPHYKFDVTGKTDSEKRSIQLVVKNNELYLRMNFPSNGTCTENLQDLRVTYTGSRGTDGQTYFYLAFKYSLSCDNKYETIFIFFDWVSEDYYDSAGERMSQASL